MAVLALTNDPDAPEPEREELFSIDGVPYTIPVQFPAGLGLQYTRVAILQGRDVALCWALEAALGVAGYEALMGYQQLKPEHLEQICTVVLERIAGGMEVPKAGLRAV